MLKKINRILSKYDLIVVTIVSIMFFSIHSLYNYIEVNDEMFNFANCYKMYNGELIYSNISVIITPIFFLISNVFFKIIGANFLAFKIYNIMIFSTLSALAYIIFRKRNLSKNRALVATIAWMCIIKGVIGQGANYNILVYIPIFVGIIIQISNIRENKKCILQGLMIFLAFATKQNIGAYYIVANLLFNLFEAIVTKEYKKQFIITMKQLITAGILLAGMIIIMQMLGNLYGFIDYTIMGIQEFKGNYIFNIGNFLSLISCVVFLAMLLVMLNLIGKSKKENARLDIFLIFVSLTNMGTIYPLCNQYHFLCALIPLMILTLGVCVSFFSENIKMIFSKKLIKAINIIVVTTIFIIFAIRITLFLLEVKNTEYDYPEFYGVFLKDEDKKDLKEMCDYINEQKEKGINVQIISQRSLFYSIALKSNDNLFEIPFLGNFGKKGEEGKIELIKKLTNSKILIVTDEKDMHTQESKKIREYIINNLTKEGTIGLYDVYIK